MHRFVEDPKNDTYLDLLDYLFKEAHEFSLYVYPYSIYREYSEEAVKMFHELEPYITGIDYLKFYISNNLNLWDNKRYYFKANEHTLEIIKKYNVQGFFAWMRPKLLDDLCLYKEKRSEWIYTIAHEKIAFIKMKLQKKLKA